MRVGYFGGSFDPPHRGHLAVACAARDAFELDRVLLAPTGRQPLKPDGSTAGFADRLSMTELLCAGERGLAASGIDGPQPENGPNYTSETLRRLRAELPIDAELLAIVGADAFLGIPRWHEMAALFTLSEWIVVSRPGVSEAQLSRVPLTAAEWKRVHLLRGVAEPASATEVREHLRAGAACETWLTPRVAGYIREHGLYR